MEQKKLQTSPAPLGYFFQENDADGLPLSLSTRESQGRCRPPPLGSVRPSGSRAFASVPSGCLGHPPLSSSLRPGARARGLFGACTPPSTGGSVRSTGGRAVALPTQIRSQTGVSLTSVRGCCAGHERRPCGTSGPSETGHSRHRGPPFPLHSSPFRGNGYMIFYSNFIV